ncbi:hypothetical protein NBO_156g0001 [Nosema bombycis CQ1]|uniref:Uncharacterized protein n=1 Tax=Nosema bombycis (strain CQ1 / CVCC 102059) TaxID=578461 RepID=R0M559_NOSB1|nr:hypothetical protein NBO_156g0001 [Nosema bombycis CQ1]|eukprot:EOB13144.1 hypothetical protein NBO_156g0001 [Nosema bombycis CQ1]
MTYRLFSLYFLVLKNEQYIFMYVEVKITLVTVQIKIKSVKKNCYYVEKNT